MAFINGIRIFKPHEKAPDFVIANLVFTKSELLNQLNELPESFKGNIKLSKKGGYYLELDTSESNNRQEKPIAANNNAANNTASQGNITDKSIGEDSLPF